MAGDMSGRRQSLHTTVDLSRGGSKFGGWLRSGSKGVKDIVNHIISETESRP